MSQSTTMNPWESCALEYRFTPNGKTREAQVAQCTQKSDVSDPLIYPGLYAPSGLDVMTVLFRIFARPNPQIDLGPIDCSVALLVCDLALPDAPIVYASDPFMEMTGYRMNDIRGKNCRFLQAPGGNVKPRSTRKYIDQRTILGMREAVKANKEHQTEITNFKKDGRPFVNILTIIPIQWDTQEFRYSVGFQHQKE
ncbi:vivid pas protein vvd [Diaporthe amygdali]|uniref:vivid pas protein vvd n=1 Tax=Phomopsis amygdali TaxID=1214568 RepID=UPI0022FEF584|nr:vivid pas protein vvd [Diaporthe amygdali]KAJ0109875.1 vivid pas protein vvd [Diaporthe amygdali]